MADDRTPHSARALELAVRDLLDTPVVRRGDVGDGRVLPASTTTRPERRPRRLEDQSRFLRFCSASCAAAPTLALVVREKDTVGDSQTVCAATTPPTKRTRAWSIVSANARGPKRVRYAVLAWLNAPR